MPTPTKTTRVFIWIIAIGVGLGLIGTLFGGGEETATSVVEEPQTTSKNQEIECSDVPSTTQQFFQQNATDKLPSARLSHGRMVRSPRSYQGRSIYFLSFAVDGGEHIATWMQTGRDPNSSMQGAVKETYAVELSVLGTAGDAPVHHLSWPGAQKSVECVRQVLP